MSTGKRAPLTRDRILETGVELADEHGLTALSMRKLAGRLGFEVMSLYNHVASKDDLLEGMLDLVSGEIEDSPADASGWKARLRCIAISAHEMLLRHRWAGELWPHVFPGPARWRYMESILELLKEAGLTGHERDLGFHAVTLHVTGFTQQQLAYAVSNADSRTSYARIEHELPEQDYPLMNEHIRYHQDMDTIPGERADDFRFVLDLILDGLDRSSA